MDAIGRLFTWFATTSRSPFMLAARVLAGFPLFAIGLAHVFRPDAPMQPIIEAMGLPMPALLAAVGVVTEIIAGVLLLTGAWGRLGGLLGIGAMSVATWSHLAIDVWPNPSEPPVVLPLVILAASALVVGRGSGRWSVDSRATAH